MLHFYCDLLGFSVSKKMEEYGEYMDTLLSLRGIRVRTVKLAVPSGGMVELLHFVSHPPTELWNRTIFDLGLSHIALTVSDLDGEYERLCRHHVEFLSPPIVSKSAKVAFALDPEGGFVELVEVLH